MIGREREALVDAGANEVGDVFKIEGGDIGGSLINGARAEIFEGGGLETGAAGQKGGLKDTASESAVLALEKSYDGIDNRLVLVTQGKKSPGGLGELIVLLHGIEDSAETLFGEELEDQLNAEVSLRARDALLAKVAGQVSRGGIRRVELR